jgi:hypothetical protein
MKASSRSLLSVGRPINTGELPVPPIRHSSRLQKWAASWTTKMVTIRLSGNGSARLGAQIPDAIRGTAITEVMKDA